MNVKERNEALEREMLKRMANAKPGDKITLTVPINGWEEAAQFVELHATDPLAEPELQEEARRVAEKLRRRVGRKPKPASQLRRNKTILRFTDSEFAEIMSLVGERELAEVVRELALEAARARLATDR